VPVLPALLDSIGLPVLVVVLDSIGLLLEDVQVDEDASVGILDVPYCPSCYALSDRVLRNSEPVGCLGYGESVQDGLRTVLATVLVDIRILSKMVLPHVLYSTRRCRSHEGILLLYGFLKSL
jgi:hypothetical protein